MWDPTTPTPKSGAATPNPQDWRLWTKLSYFNKKYVAQIGYVSLVTLRAFRTIQISVIFLFLNFDYSDLLYWFRSYVIYIQFKVVL